MKKLAYAILIFFFLKILFTLFSGDFLKIITGFQFGFLIGDPILIGSIIPYLLVVFQLGMFGLATQPSLI